MEMRRWAWGVLLIMAVCGCACAETIFESSGATTMRWDVQWHQSISATNSVAVWASNGTVIKGSPFHSTHHNEDLGGAMFHTAGFTMEVGDVLTFSMDWQGKGIETGVNHWWYNFGIRAGGSSPWAFGDIVARSFFRTGQGVADRQGFIAWNSLSDAWTEPFPHCEILSDENYKSETFRIIWTVERIGTGFGPSTMTVINKQTGAKTTATGTVNQSDIVMPSFKKLYFFHEIPSEFSLSGDPLISTVGTWVKVSNMKLEIERAVPEFL